METTDILMLILYLILQIFIGGLIFNGVKRLIEVIKNKKTDSKFNISFLVTGIIGLSFFLLHNTLQLIEKF